MIAVAMDTSWHEPALALRAEGLDAAEVGERVGKHPATVRKLFARNPGPDPEPDTPSSNGNGNGHGPISTEDAERLREAAGFDVVGAGYEPDTDPIPGQTTIDGGEVGYDKPAFEAEAGEAVGPMPPREMDAGEVTYDSDIEVSGTTQLGLFDAGGRGPESASVRLAGGKIGLVFGEAFRKGDVIHFSGTAVVTAVKQQDKRDSKTGLVVGCEQQHTALITDLTVN